MIPKLIRNHSSKALLLLLIVYAAYAFYSLAQVKPFWLDEAIEIKSLQEVTYGSIVRSGAPRQCSPHPFYYLLQKPIIDFTPVLDASILNKFRWIALAASTGTLLIFCFFIFQTLGQPFGHTYGISWALLGLAMVINQPIFKRFSAENRPYMLWVFLFTTLLVLGPLISGQRQGLESRNRKFLYWLFLLCLPVITTTAAPGFIQGAIFSLYCLLFIDRKKRFLKHLTFFLIPSLAIFAYYAQFSCSGLDNAHGWHEIRDVLLLLFPSGSLNVPLNLLVVIGILSPLFIWLAVTRNKTVTQVEKSSAQISLAVLFQLVATGFIGIAVAINGYYFIQRMFIYLVICRALLIVCGAAFLYETLFNRILRASPICLKAGPPIVFLVALITLIHSYRTLTVPIQNAHKERVKTAEAPCPDWALSLRQKGIAVLPIIESNAYAEVGLNRVVELDKQLRNCPKGLPSEKAHYHALVNGAVQIFPNLPPNYKVVPYHGIRAQ